MDNRIFSDYAPIVMFVYNRADHFTQTYEALAKCPETNNSILYIFSDGAKNDNAKPQVEQVRQTAKDFAGRHDFLDVIITESPENKGLARSIIDGVTSVLDEYGKAMKYYKKALDVFVNSFGEEHPNTKIIQENMDGLLEEMKKKPMSYASVVETV
jgi:glycosyltransferase involved in cell wall biosynthesis